MTAQRPAAEGVAERAWLTGFVVTLMLAMSLGGLLQFALGTLAPFITVDLGLSRARFGVLATLYFGVGMVASPLLGPQVDRFGGHKMTYALFGACVAGFAGMALSRGFWTLAAATGVVGIACALMNPATNALIAEHMPRGRQGVLMGVKQSGVQVGAFLTGALMPAGALLLGWQSVLAIVAAVSCAAFVLSWRVLSARRPLHHGSLSTPADHVARRRLRAGHGGFVAWLSAYGFLMGAGVAAAGTFVVLYAVETLAFTKTAAGLVAALMGLVGVVARVLWGRAAERARGVPQPLAWIAAGGTIAQLLILAAPAGGVWLLWVGAAGFGATAASWNSVGMLAIVRTVDRLATGWASGIVQAAFYMGLVASPIAFGWTVDMTGGYALGWAAVTVSYASALAVALLWHRRDSDATP